MTALTAPDILKQQPHCVIMTHHKKILKKKMPQNVLCTWVWRELTHFIYKVNSFCKLLFLPFVTLRTIIPSDRSSCQGSLQWIMTHLITCHSFIFRCPAWWTFALCIQYLEQFRSDQGFMSCTTHLRVIHIISIFSWRKTKSFSATVAFITTVCEQQLPLLFMPYPPTARSTWNLHIIHFIVCLNSHLNKNQIFSRPLHMFFSWGCS